MTIGIGVEGPSDRMFWSNVLHTKFAGVRFDIHNMRGRPRLIREAPRLIDSFRSAHYDLSIILVDRDNTPCVHGVLDEFDSFIRDEAKRPLSERSVLVCVAIKELEAWYLADQNGINKVPPRSNYEAPRDTGVLNAQRQLDKLWRLHYVTAFNKILFANEMSRVFDPELAKEKSASFSHFWGHITRLL